MLFRETLPCKYELRYVQEQLFGEQLNPLDLHSCPRGWGEAPPDTAQPSANQHAAPLQPL